MAAKTYWKCRGCDHVECAEAREVDMTDTSHGGWDQVEVHPVGTGTELARMNKGIRDHIWVDATPDEGLVERILSAYIDESTVSDNILGLPPSSPVLIVMNEAQAKRNQILREAIASAVELAALRALRDRVRDDALAKNCVDAFATFGRAGAGMALAAYRGTILKEEP